MRGGTPVLLRLPDVDLVDDKAGKVVGIQQVIGRRPLAAFGNSDGDFEMLDWVSSAPSPRLAMIVLTRTRNASGPTTVTHMSAGLRGAWTSPASEAGSSST